MSHITDVLVTWDINATEPEEMDDDPGPDKAWWTAQINGWLETDHHAPLVDVQQHAGGEKYMATPVLLGSFNHFDTEGFLGFLAALPWGSPECVQVLEKDECVDVWTLHTLPEKPWPDPPPPPEVHTIEHRFPDGTTMIEYVTADTE